MKVIIDLKTWYAFGNVADTVIDYEPMLLNPKGQQCCLGFCAASHGIPPSKLEGTPTPTELIGDLEEDDWMIRGGSVFRASELAELAMQLNDCTESDEIGWREQPFSVRMGNLITVFAEGGDELEFVP